MLIVNELFFHVGLKERGHSGAYAVRMSHLQTSHLQTDVIVVLVMWLILLQLLYLDWMYYYFLILC